MKTSLLSTCLLLGLLGLLGLHSAACAPESIQVITPRPAAAPDKVGDAGTNRADEADQRLRQSSDQATHIQDIIDEPVHMQDEPTYIIYRDE